MGPMMIEMTRDPLLSDTNNPIVFCMGFFIRLETDVCVNTKS